MMQMQQKHKRVPPIVPKKKIALESMHFVDSTDAVVLPNFKPRQTKETHNSVQPTLEALVDQISLKTTYEVEKPRKNEPKAIKYDDVMKPIIRKDIRSPYNPRSKGSISPDLNTSKPLSKPKPVLKPKPKTLAAIGLDSVPGQLKERSPVQKPCTSKHEIAGHLQTLPPQMAIPLPGLASSNKFGFTNKNSSNNVVPLPSVIRQLNTNNTFLKQKATTIDNASLNSFANSSSNAASNNKQLTHLNKQRSRGPKRRPPKAVTTDESISDTKDQKNLENSINSKKRPPPVPPKKKSLMI